MRARIVISALLLGVGLLPAIQSAAAVETGQSVEKRTARYIEPVEPLRVIGSDRAEPRKPLAGPRRNVDQSVADPGSSAESSDATAAEQDSARAGGLVTLSEPLVEFDGQGGRRPNDTNGDVGPNHFVQAINGGFQVFDKTGTSLAGPQQISTLWNDGTRDEACEFERGDPIVLYDNLADRWVISQFQPKPTETGGAFSNFICVAVSQTPDPRPSQGYNLYAFNVGEFPDYFKLGAWTDGYYMSANGGSVPVFVFDRLNMLNGNPAGAIDFGDLPNTSYTGFDIVMPADIDGSTAPPSGSGFFYRPIDGDVGGGADRVELYSANVNWGNPAASTLTGPTNINVAAFDQALCGFGSFGCVPQPGTTALLDPVNEAAMFRFPYRNYGDREVLAGNFTVDVNGSDGHGIRWFVLERTGGGAWGVADQGTYAPQPVGAPAFVNRFMGSIAMDRNGNLAIGYTASSGDGGTAGAGVFPSARYTGRLASDPPGTLTATERTLEPGVDSIAADGQPAPDQNDTRWGDYYALTVDPVDDCTFWYTGDYAAAGGAGTNDGVRQSRIGSFRFSDCGTDLAISKTVTPEHPNAGEEIVYTVTVTNNGPLDAQNVVVTDQLPTQVDYLANTDSCTGVAVGSSGTLTCPLGTIPAGQSKSFQIKVKVDPDLGGATAITNTATVTGQPAESDTSNNTIALTHLVNEQADVRTTKFCKPDTHPAPAGTSGVCTIFVANDGPSAARSVSLTDTHVSDGTFTIGPATASAGSCGAPSGGAVTCSLGTIQPGATVRVDVPVTSNDGVDVNDRAVASSATPDAVTGNNESTAGLSFEASADLSITKTGPASAVAGTQFTYTVGVDNAGPSTATGVVVTDELPSGVEFVSATADVGTFTAGGGTVEWTLGTVAPGDPVREIDITVKVLPQATGQLVNNASVTSQTSDPDSSDNQATWTTTVTTSAGLTVSKSDSPDPVTAGSQLSYTVVVGNAGPSTAQDVVLTDTLPDEVTFVSAVDGTGTVACAQVQVGVVSCDIGDLDPGETVTIIITVKVDSDVPNGTVLENVATVTSPTDPDGATDTETTLVVTSAELWIEKTGTSPAGNPSGALIYRITVHNHAGSAPDDTPTSGAGGPSDAQNVVVVDTLPLTSKKLVVQFLSPSCTYSSATHKVTCTTPTLPAGTAVTYEIQVQIKGSSGTLTNRATVTSTTSDPVTGNNTDTVANVVQGGTGKPPRP